MIKLLLCFCSVCTRDISQNFIIKSCFYIQSLIIPHFNLAHQVKRFPNPLDVYLFNQIKALRLKSQNTVTEKTRRQPIHPTSARN